jgi:hypothetical protein
MRCTFFLFVSVAGQHIDLSKNDCRKVKTNVYRSTCVVLLMLIYTSESENYCQDVSLFHGRSLSVAGGYPSPAPTRVISRFASIHAVGVLRGKRLCRYQDRVVSCRVSCSRIRPMAIR